MPLVDLSGGRMAMEYRNPVAGERHELHLAVAAFDATPSGPFRDNLYTGVGPYAPAELGILATFAAFAALWQQFYSADWTLYLTAVLQNRGGFMTDLPVVPLAVPVPGTADLSAADLGPTTRRYSLRTSGRRRYRLWLKQVLANVAGPTAGASTAAGGYDARDPAMVAYLSGGATGIVGADGLPFEPSATVHSWWARPLEPVPPSGARDVFVQPSPPPNPQDGWLWVNTLGENVPREVIMAAVNTVLAAANVLVVCTAPGLVITLPDPVANAGLAVTVRDPAGGATVVNPDASPADDGFKSPWNGLSDGTQWWNIDY